MYPQVSKTPARLQMSEFPHPLLTEVPLQLQSELPLTEVPTLLVISLKSSKPQLPQK